MNEPYYKEFSYDTGYDTRGRVG